MVPEFQTQYKYSPPVGEKNEGPDLVEKTGYVPSNVLIENMIYAGQRLDNVRSEYYDFPDADSVDEEFIDPTRKAGFDLADATQMNRSVQGRIAEQRKIYEAEQVRLKLEKEAKDALEGAKNDGT